MRTSAEEQQTQKPMKYLNPKADPTFKKVFGEHPDLVMSLLNALLPLEEGEEITELEYLPAEMVPDNPLRKNSIVDVRCRDNRGRHFIVEMQMVWSQEFRQRVLFNASKAYVRQIEKGNDYFHRVEEAVLLGVEAENTVIATGGSAVYFPDALERFKKSGTVVYLDITLESVLERLRNIKTRGVTLEKGQTLEDLYNARTPLYESRGDVRVKADGGTVEDVIERIIKALG